MPFPREKGLENGQGDRWREREERLSKFNDSYARPRRWRGENAKLGSLRGGLSLDREI